MKDLPLPKVYQLLEPGSGGSADDRPQGPRQRHDDVLAYDGRV
jgi:hypothetical protein